MNSRRRRTGRFLAPVLFLCCILPMMVVRAESTSAEHGGLRQLLQRYPEADLDGDGVLTMDEARRYRTRLWQEDSARGEPVPATPERVEQVRPALRVTNPTYAAVAYGSLPGQTVDIWLPRNTPPVPAVLVCATDHDTEASLSVPQHLLDGCLEAGLAVVQIHQRESGDSASYFEDVAAARCYLQERAPTYGLEAGRMGVFAESEVAEHALALAFTGPRSMEGLPDLPGLACAAVLDATLARTLSREPRNDPESYLSANWPHLYQALNSSNHRPPVLLLGSASEAGAQLAALQDALQPSGSKVAVYEAQPGERRTHLLRMAALFFRQHLAAPEAVSDPKPEHQP